MKVMIVDDEPAILKGLLKVVKDSAPEFAEVALAHNAFDALEKMMEHRPDVTITDLNMPEMDGFALIAEAKSRELCNRFIILTGYDEFQYALQAIRAGVIDYLLKPINKSELSVLLHRIAAELPVICSADDRDHAAKILGFIELNYSKDLSLDLLAEHLNLHPNYISSLFSKETGTTFVQYINTVRIREAKKQLAEFPHVPVNSIGARVGFENRHYFNKVFKKFTGMTPGQYRAVLGIASSEDHE
ncbi:response regulator [Paenibacillus sp. sptzw28]|uniref:response regulator transcription factor n=1 Tax=Paenibacillus sp. sptzw28 TaxID=715179 RepID=UPI001C6F3271|nr:response regulator [Paenibacillus sp. sptzw28]QYR20303.1 response regulator [Paenibacillus sp. sptzw28]